MNESVRHEGAEHASVLREDVGHVATASVQVGMDGSDRVVGLERVGSSGPTRHPIYGVLTLMELVRLQNLRPLGYD